MGEIGSAALLIAFFVSVYSIVVSVLGGWQGSASLIESGRRGLLAVAFLSTVGSLSLLYLLLTNDFRYQYVYETTSTFQPLIYHISALWQGQVGSILFWLWMLSLIAAWYILRRRPAEHPELPYTLAILAALEGFFVFLLLTAADPFALAPQVHIEGFGGNPLLENPGMIYHPPTILAGYAATTVPYAVFLAGLLVGRVGDRRWINGLRPWVLLSWLLLSIGILLGAQWAYVELGWGGYWAWDPVENASLIPWLVNTALLHSLMMQERRGMFKLWNALLVSATFLLCIFATWITRGGAINSVHSFGESPIGDTFLIGLLVMGAFSAVVILARRRHLRSEFEIEALASREAGFLYTTLLFVGAAVLVFLGTLFPSLSQSVLGREIAWGTESYDRITRILAPLLLLLLGVCPVLGWRRSDEGKLQRALTPSLIAAVVTALLVALLVGGLSYAVLGFALVAFVAVTILSEFYQGWRVRVVKGEGAVTALVRLVGRNRRRYGGYVVHLGVLLIVLGITGQSFYRSSERVALDPGDSVTVGPYTLQYVDSGTEETRAKRRFYAALDVYRDGELQFTMHPERNFHWNVQQWVTEVALRSNPVEDLYVLLLSLEEDRLGTFEIIINPLMMWLWIGGAVATLGTLLAVWPAAQDGVPVRPRA